jgi:hypothetical protein
MVRFFGRASRLGLLLITAAALVGCPNYIFEQKFPDKVKEKQIVMPAATPLPADILFVVDDSCSMDNKQENLRQNFSAFINQIAGVGDYQIGVVTTDQLTTVMGMPTEMGGISKSDFETDAPFALIKLERSPQDGSMGATCAPVMIDHGCFRGPDASKRIIKSSALDAMTQIKAFQDNAQVGSCGSGIEQGLKSVRAALQKAGQGQCNEGFLRDNANLVIIILSDENDTDTTPVDQYVNDIASLKNPAKIRVATIVASEGGGPSNCNAKDMSNCGKQVCAAKPQQGSHTACTGNGPCPTNEQCTNNNMGGSWCENIAYNLWSPAYCGWCTFFNAPDCCYAIQNANPESDRTDGMGNTIVPDKGRYVLWAQAMEAKIAPAAGLQMTGCKPAMGSAAACLVDTICQDNFSATLARIASELVLTNTYNLNPPTTYPAGVAVHLTGGRFGDDGKDLVNCASVPAGAMCDFTVGQGGTVVTIMGANTPMQGESVQIYYIVPAD